MENQENYTKVKLTIDLGWANIFSVLMIIPAGLVFGLPYWLIWKNNVFRYDFPFQNDFVKYGMLILVFIVGIVAHELIHGMMFAKFAKNGFKSIKFGVMWKMFSPYCHCKEPLTKRQYVIGAITPAIILGFIPAILAIILGNIVLLAFGIVFILAASGDFLIIHALRKEKMYTFVEDHPSEAGCFVYRPIEN